MKTTHIISATLLFISLSQIIFAQDSTTKKTTSTEDKLKAIEAIVSKLPQISGFINVRYQYSSVDSYNSGQNGFDVRRAYLDFKGNATKELSYRLQLDFAGTPKILDAYAEWKPSKFIGLQAGQFKVPYTLENPYSPTNLETIDNSQVISALITDIAGNKNNGRDIGVAVNGSLLQKEGFNIIDYKLGFFNGNVINSTENNTTKDVVGTLLINPIKPLSLGVSYYTGKYGAQAAKYTRQRASFGAKYDDGKLLVRSEFITGKGTTKADVKAKGFYTSAVYYVTNKLQPVLKYDYYQSDNSNSQTPITKYVAGINYWIKKTTRVQLNYTLSDYKDSSKKNGSYIVTQLFVGF